MSQTVKFALFTDFSDESRVALNTLIFNTWGFDFDLDIICISEDHTINECKQKLEELELELDFHLEQDHQIQSKIFLKGEEDKLISHINSEAYFYLLLGIADSEDKWRANSIHHKIYYQVNVDTALVPLHHQIKIENRGMVALEFENLEKLHTLKRSEEFFKFYFAKLKLIVISDNLLSNDDNKMIREFTANVLPGLEIEISNFKKTASQDAILHTVLESPIDYFMYFSDDYLEDVVHGKLEGARLPGIHKFTLIKLAVDLKMLNTLKHERQKISQIKLKDHQKQYS